MGSPVDFIRPTSMKGNKMNRRNFLFASGAAIASGGIALSSETVRTVVFGHANDVVSRLTPDVELTDGKLTHKGIIREDDPGQDPIHRAGGTVEIIDGNIIQLKSDFWSTPGPDYHVYISNTLDIVDEETFKASQQVELGRLQKGSGASEYLSPVTLNNDVSVTIWCKAFGEFIGSANVRLF